MRPSVQTRCQHGTATASASLPVPAPAPPATLTFCSSLGLCTALGMLAVSAHASLVSNGSFEAPSVPVGGYTGFPAGSPGIAGWSIVGTDVVVTSGSFTQSGITFQAQDGNQFLDLSGVSSNSNLNGVTQSFSTTPGATYTVSFYVGSATDGTFFFPSTIDLSIDGNTPVSYSNPAAPSDLQDWKPFSVGFVATGNLASLAFYNGGAGNNYNAALDNVSVFAAVPEPTSMGLVLAALCATGVATRAGRR